MLAVPTQTPSFINELCARPNVKNLPNINRYPKEWPKIYSHRAWSPAEPPSAPEGDPPERDAGALNSWLLSVEGFLNWGYPQMVDFIVKNPRFRKPPNPIVAFSGLQWPSVAFNPHRFLPHHPHNPTLQLVSWVHPPVFCFRGTNSFSSHRFLAENGDGVGPAKDRRIPTAVPIT